MAKRKANKGSAPRSVRSSSSSRRAAPAAAEVDIIEEEDSGNWDTVMVLVTTLALVGALVVLDMYNGKYFDAGKLF